MLEQDRNRRFERIVTPHLDAAYNLARWLIRDHHDAEDVVQNAMLRAYRYLDSCREETARPWLLRIVRNACYDWLHAKAAAPVTGFADFDPEDEAGANFSTDVFGATALSPESLLQREDDRGLIEAMLQALPPEFREIIVLRELEALSYKEIAEIAGIPVGTVMSRLSRGRGLLVKEWKRRNEEAGEGAGQ